MDRGYLNITEASHVEFSDGTHAGKPLYIKMDVARPGLLRRRTLMLEIVWIDELGGVNRRCVPHTDARVLFRPPEQAEE